MIEKFFVTAGDAIFTLEMPQDFASKHDLPPHYTYRVEHREAKNGYPENWFVSLLTGPNNTKDYSYLGLLEPQQGTIRLTAKSRYTETSWPVRLIRRVLERLWAGEQDKLTAAGFDLHHIGKCGRCGDDLTVPASVKDGIGPVCRKIMGLAPLDEEGNVRRRRKRKSKSGSGSDSNDSSIALMERPVAEADDDVQPGSFQEWIGKVDAILSKKLGGLPHDELPDIDYMGMFEVGESPSSAARAAISRLKNS